MTSISPGFVRTELSDYLEDAEIRAQAQQRMSTIGVGPDGLARAVAIDQPDDVGIGDITIQPTVQN